jgi:hypothetical protein
MNMSGVSCGGGLWITMRKRLGFTLVKLLAVIAMPSRSISPSTGRSASGPAAQAASRRKQAGGTTLLP